MAATTFSRDDVANGLHRAQTVLASGARTTTQTSEGYYTYGALGVHAYLNMTTVGTGSVTLTIQGYNLASDTWYTILTGAAVVTNVANRYTIFPGATAAANVTVNEMLPPIIRFVVTANNANSATYSLGFNLGG